MDSSLLPISRDVWTLYPSFRKYWLPVALTLGFSLGSAVFEGFSIGMLIPFLQTFTGDEETFRTGITWIDTHLLGTEASKVGRMYRICGLILVATLARSALGYLSSVYMVISRARIVQDLRQRVTDRLAEVALAYYATTRTGEIMNSVTNEINRTVGALSALFGFVKTGALMLMYGAIMFWISWTLSLIALVAFLVLSVALNTLLSRIRSSGEDITSANANFADRISEFISGVRTATAYNMRDTERAQLHEAAERAADAGIHANKQSKIIQPLSKAVISVVLILLVIVALQYFVLEGALSMAFLLTFLFALFRLMPKVHSMNHQRGLWAQNSAGLSNVAELIRPAEKPHLEDGSRTASSLTDAIIFDDVSFSYRPGSPVLKGINLRIEKGETTALVGATGAGKSTLVDLIPRFYDPTEGRVLYDGTDLRDFDRSSLRARIAIVSQDTHIFNDTAEANIAYGASDSSRETVEWAARQANALHFIEEMEEGFETVLGEGGVRVSGGQRQRIAIARALLQDPDLLILDEATSDLDSVTEKLVQEALERLMRDRTVVAIAHRLSTIEHADKVAVLEDGEIVERGPYEELLAQSGKLWEYHQAQYQRDEGKASLEVTE
jgi:subfamily B ATP-binding cassette protein MsbA